MRDLHGPTQSRAIRDLLQSLFVLEPVRPRKPLWLLAAWETYAPMLVISACQFAGIVHIVTRPHELNAPFIERMRSLQRSYAGRVKLLVEENFHDKGLVGDDYELAGSMNFTRAGININTEHVILRTDPSFVAERRL